MRWSGWPGTPGLALAEATLQEALAIAADHGYAPVQAQTLRALSQLRLRTGDAVAAVAILRRAATLAEAVGMRPNLASIRRLLVDALRALGRHTEACAEDAAAAAIVLALRPLEYKGQYGSSPVLLPVRTEPSA